MKKLTLGFLASILINIGFTQEFQKISLSDEKSFLQVIDNGFQGVRFTLKQEEINLVVRKTVQGEFISIHSDNLINTFTPGYPDLPIFSKLIEVPFGANVSVKVIGYNEQIVDLSEFWGDKKIEPAQPSVSKSEETRDIPFHFQKEVYNSNTFLNSETAIYEEAGILRNTRLGRIEIRPIQYNPVRNQLKILNELEIEVLFEGSDYSQSERVKNVYNSPFFSNLPGVSNHLPIAKNVIQSAPVTYVIVSDPMFQEALQPFIEWKKRKGFHVIEGYTNDPEVGNTTTSIQLYLKNLYENPDEGVNPPTFGLLVGDVAQIPSFAGTTGSHKTDLYYFEYTTDKLPEVIYGRFSAQTIEQLQSQVDKTLEYEMYLMEDPGYLANQILIAGVDATWAPVYANGHIRYAHTNYSNPSNNINPYTYLYNDAAGSTTGIASNNSSASADIRLKLSAGVGLANYTAHCSSSGWSNPVVGLSNIPELTNSGKYGIWIGNCCQSNKFDITECFGEAALRAVNKGAVGYIGGSNDTYWYEDYYFGVGAGTPVAVPDYNNFGTGMYDALFHTQANEVNDQSKWYITQGQLLLGGNLAVQASSSSRKAYYWEIYHLMGDPSLTPYLGEPQPMEVEFPIPVLMISLSEFEVNTVPFAQISLNQDGVSIAVAIADPNGYAVLNLEPNLLQIGEAEIVITAQNRQPYIQTMPVISSEPYANFYADSILTIINEEVVFTDASANGEFTSWEWNFGDGATPSTATGKGPHTVTYSSPGYKTVSLIVDNQFERIRTNYIYVRDIFTLTVNTEGIGTVEVDGVPYSIPVNVVEGTTVDLNAVAEEYWSFKEWTGDLTGSEAQDEIVVNSNKIVTAIFVNVGSSTYTLGDIPTDNTFTSVTGQSTCPATLVVSIPPGSVITSVDVEYTMTAANQGWKSEQRSQLRCVSPGGASEETITAGIGNSEGKMVYSRKGLTIANGVQGGGDIIFELHAGRTWSTSGYSGCSVYNNRVDNGSWKVFVYYEPGGIKFPQITSWPAAGDIVYGTTLSESQLVGGLAEFDGQEVPGLFSFISSDSVPFVGTHSMLVEFVPNDLDTYGPVQGNVNMVVIQRELTIAGSFEAQDKEYDGSALAIFEVDNLVLEGIVGGDDVIFSPEIEFTDEMAGLNKSVYITSNSFISGVQSDNYLLNFNVSPTSVASILHKTLNVEGATANTKFYDGNNVAAISGSVLSGVLVDDDVQLGNHTFGYFNQKDVGENISVTTSMMITGADAVNYNLVQPVGLSASILPKELTVINALAQNKVYDGNAEATITGAELNGYFSEDEVLLENQYYGLFSQSDVGENISIQVDMNISGADSQNYYLTQPILAAAITPKELKVGGSFTVADKVYDGTTVAVIESVDLFPIGLVNEDLIEVVNPVAEFENPEEGEDKMVYLKSVEISGEKTGNYTISLSDAPTTTASIYPVAPTQYTVSISLDGDGKVFLNDAEYTQSLKFNEGTEIAIEAIPNQGWQFAQWQGDVSGTANPVNVMVNNDLTITAQFTEIPQYSIVVTVTGNGGVIINNAPYSNQFFVFEGTELVFDVVPDENWQFESWSDDLEGNEHPVQLQINSNKNIGAIFTPITGFEQYISKDVAAFPNPFTNKIYIRNAEAVSRLLVTNIIGQNLIDISSIGQSEFSFSTEMLPQGIYLVTFISFDGEKTVKKMVKEK